MNNSAKNFVEEHNISIDDVIHFDEIPPTSIFCHVFCNLLQHMAYGFEFAQEELAVFELYTQEYIKLIKDFEIFRLEQFSPNPTIDTQNETNGDLHIYIRKKYEEYRREPFPQKHF